MSFPYIFSKSYSAVHWDWCMYWCFDLKILTSKQKFSFWRLAIQLGFLGGITIISLGDQATKWVFIHEKRSCTILLNFSWRFELEWQMPTHDAINLEPKSRLVMIRFLTLIGMIYASKKNAHLWRHLGVFFIRLNELVKLTRLMSIFTSKKFGNCR